MEKKIHNEFWIYLTVEQSLTYMGKKAQHGMQHLYNNSGEMI